MVSSPPCCKKKLKHQHKFYYYSALLVRLFAVLREETDGYAHVITQFLLYFDIQSAWVIISNAKAGRDQGERVVS